ncbi:D-alanyl-D-alanine carboxypeptidase [Natroniella sulfidigena]|uniref:D-alanyl-D-alanine carboxypeptidase family protein n=1 Tax=Natroniella sulfidigena TaxID=723921 RepID=UPI00200A7334|nr:D-alanyl-D-alanine carboxypeptidase family protein [Natroniella sulfidigena]MCK8817022.1 D-alanyl-D-alanine carboxypeptidase [Natroniella sulfidigena]
MLSFKRGVSSLLIILFLALIPTAYASEPDLDLKSAMLVEAETGQVLYSYNEDLELAPASITKTMALLLVMEALEAGEISLEEEVEATRLAQSKGGSQIWLQAGEKMTVEDLLKAVIIPSANDATVALAEHIGGSKDNFVRQMNRRAEELGLENTYFGNATGLPVRDGQDSYSTAEDIAVMSRELIKYDLVMDYSARRTARIRGGEYPIYTTNNFIGHFEGADGLKTGWTTQAGYNLVGTAERDGVRFISVVLGTDSDQARVNETARLLDYAFRAFHETKLINSGVEVEQVEVDKGEELEVPVVTATEFSAFIERGTKDEIEQEVRIEEELEAPVEEGARVGELLFIQEDQELGRVELVTAEEVERAGILTLLFRWIKNFILGFFA